MRTGAFAAYYATAGHNILFTVITKSDGTFVSTTQQPLPATNYPFGVVASDLNGDGNPDLVAVGYVPTPSGTSATPAMTVLLGNADGSFTIGQIYPLPDAIADSAAIDDFNGDGKLDVVVPTRSFAGDINSGGTLLFFPGNGMARWARPKRRA
jgi:FG-GAP-like repeat